MSIERVRRFFKNFGRGDDIIEREESTATVQLAADALGIIPARIAKSIAVEGPEGSAVLLVTAGDAYVDNRKFREVFGVKPTMLSPERTLEATGHQVGGVCPFALPEDTDLTVALDISLKRFESVYPACGSANSAIEVTLPQLEEYTEFPRWVDASRDWDAGLS